MNILQKLTSWLRWGRLRQEVKSIDGGFVSEYAVISSRSSLVIGYWAYGYFDPSMPYSGQDAFWEKLR